MKTHILIAASLLTLAASTAALAGDDDDGRRRRRPPRRIDRVVEFDVAENALDFVFDEAPVLSNGHPAYGNPFVTHGYIYPKGFLKGNDGVDDEGNPTAPDKVIGEWYCRGYLIGNGALTVSGPFVHTVQTYSFYETPGYDPGKDQGKDIVVTQGYELADVGQPGFRAVTGGTRRFLAASGQARGSVISCSICSWLVRTSSRRVDAESI